MPAPLGNTNAIGNEGGRPPLYDSPEEMQVKIDEYFNTINKDNPATITGLALYLGFESRSSLYTYQDRVEFSYMIKRARLKVENEYEKKLSGAACTGSIFALKNMDWKDKSEVDQTVRGGVNLIIESQDGNDPISE